MRILTDKIYKNGNGNELEICQLTKKLTEV
jgi:hypothetical protein